MDGGEPAANDDAVALPPVVASPPVASNAVTPVGFNGAELDHMRMWRAGTGAGAHSSAGVRVGVTGAGDREGRAVGEAEVQCAKLTAQQPLAMVGGSTTRWYVRVNQPWQTNQPQPPVETCSHTASTRREEVGRVQAPQELCDDEHPPSERQKPVTSPRRSLHELRQFDGRGWHDGEGVTALDGVGCGEVVASGAGATYALQHANAGWSARSLSSATLVLALAPRNGSVAELGSPPIQCASASGLWSHAVDVPSAHVHPRRLLVAAPALRAPSK